MDTLNILSLCSGGGGLDLGLSLALGNARTVCWVEWEAFACEYLAARMEAKQLAPAPLWSDLRTFDGKPWRGVVDIVAAGYPCQPFSLAGNRRGSSDPRHLWPHVRRVVGEVEPAICFFENVPGHLSLGFDQVATDLEALGYQVAAGLFTAAEVGASHKRERLFILAMVNDPRIRRGEGRAEPKIWSGGSPASCTGDTVAHTPDLDGRIGNRAAEEGAGTTEFRGRRFTGGGPAMADSAGKRLSSVREAHQQPNGSTDTTRAGEFPPGPTDFVRWQNILNRDQSLTPAQSKIRLLADGLAHDRARQLKLLGNGVVPLQAAYAFCSLWSALRF